MSRIEKSNSQDELEQLIEMAEKVSTNTQILEGQYSRLTFNIYAVISFLMILVIAILYFSLVIPSSELNRFKDNIPFIMFLVVVFSIIYILFKINERKKTYSVIYREKLILRKLLNMISSFKELTYENISIVSKAVIEMRLNRIQFSVGEKFTKNEYSSSELNEIDVAIDNILGDYVKETKKHQP